MIIGYKETSKWQIHSQVVTFAVQTSAGSQDDSNIQILQHIYSKVIGPIPAGLHTLEVTADVKLDILHQVVMTFLEYNLDTRTASGVKIKCQSY